MGSVATDGHAPGSAATDGLALSLSRSLSLVGGLPGAVGMSRSGTGSPSGMSGSGTASPRGTVRTVRIMRGNGLRLGDALVTKWTKPQVDPPKDFAVTDVQKEGPLNPSAPPLQLDAAPFLQSVRTACDPAISQCSPTFRRYFKQHFLSESIQNITVDAFWYCFVELFESDEDHRRSHNQVLHDRLGRNFATFCWGITPSKNKDFFLQYFPYCLVAALSQAFQATFPGSAKQLEPEEEFADYINAIISELFVHDSGSPHGKKLRVIMRENLFKKVDTAGPRRPKRSVCRRKTHRWLDIERPATGTDGKYAVAATRPAPELPTAKSPQAEFDEMFEQSAYSDQSFQDVGVPHRPMTGTCNLEEWRSRPSPLIDYFLQATSPVPHDEQALLHSTMQRSLNRAKASSNNRRRTSHRDEIRGAKPDGTYSQQARDAVQQAREAKKNYAKKRAEIHTEIEASKVMLKQERRKIRTARRSVFMEGRRALKSFSNDIIGIQERKRSGATADGLPEKQEELPGGVVLESIGGNFDYELDPGEEQLTTTLYKEPKPQWMLNLHKQKLRA